MTIQDWGSIGEIIGGIAVVLTLAYLAVQTRQNTQTVRASTINQSAQSLADLLQAAAVNSEIASITHHGYAAAAYRDETLNALEWDRFSWWNSSINFRAQDSFFQHAHGNLDDELWRSYSQFWRDNLDIPSMRGWWEAEVAAGALTPSFVAAMRAMRPSGGDELRRQQAIEGRDSD